MHITGIDLRGFRDLAEYRADGLGRVVTVQGPSLATSALADGLSLAFAALSHERLADLLVSWGCAADPGGIEITGDDFPEQAVWEDRLAAAAVVHPGQRDLVVRVELELDPPMYGRLRGEAAREPRLVAALSAGPRVALTIGGLFTQSMDGVAVSIQHFEAGGERFPVHGAERPRWLTTLLADLGTRVARVTTTRAVHLAAAAAADAATSWDHHERFLQWQTATLECTPGVDTVRPARGTGGHLLLLGGDRPLDRFGARAVERASLGAAAWLGTAEVLWVETEDPWIEKATEGDGSPLEQLWRVCEAGTLRVETVPPGEKPGPTGLPRKRLELRPRDVTDDSDND